MARYNNRASFERLVNAQAPPSQKSKLVSTGYKSNVQGWRIIGGKRYYFRSLWEINFAKYLQWQKDNHAILDWEYEPETFDFPKDAYKTGPFYYKPDFRVTGINFERSWHEVKGYMTVESKKKIKRFQKHYPDVPLYVVGPTEMKQIAQYKRLIPGWETYIPS